MPRRNRALFGHLWATYLFLYGPILVLILLSFNESGLPTAAVRLFDRFPGGSIADDMRPGSTKPAGHPFFQRARSRTPTPIAPTDGTPAVRRPRQYFRPSREVIFSEE